MRLIEFAIRPVGELYAHNPSSTIAIDVSGYASFPFSHLSPCTYSIKFQIPVPGEPGCFANSVESIWQGLKIIDGRTDFRLFKMRPRKRKGFVEGHKFGDEVLDIRLAREKIYIPSYHFFLDNYAPRYAIEQILEKSRNGERVLLYDTEENGDLSDTRPLAHSSVLATYLNIILFNEQVQAATL